jgi:hypothetical protein
MKKKNEGNSSDRAPLKKIELDIDNDHRPQQIKDDTQETSSLPEELWLSILDWAGSNSLSTMQQVNPLFYQLSNDNFIWRNVFLRFFPEDQPNLATVNFSWKEAFKTRYLELYKSTDHRTKKLVSLIVNGDALNAFKLSSQDLLANDYLLLKTAARVNNQRVLDYFYSIVVEEMRLVTENNSTLFFWAILCNQQKLIRSYLQSNPAAIELLNFEEKTITMLAAEIGHVELFEYLLGHPEHNKSKDRFLASYVAKNGGLKLFASFLLPPYLAGDVEQTPGLWSKRCERRELLTPHVLRYAALYDQDNLIKFILKMVDFKSLLLTTIKSGNELLFKKLASLKSEIENGEEVYKNLLSYMITTLPRQSESASLLENNPCIKFLLEDPSTELSLAAFHIVVRLQSTNIVQKIFARPGVDIKTLAQSLDRGTGLPIVYLLPRNSPMQNLLLPHVDLQDVLYHLILAKASLTDIRNIIYFNDHLLKRSPIKKQALLYFAKQYHRKLITDSLKLEIALETELATAGTSSFATLKRQVIATGQLRGIRYCNSKHSQLPKKIQFPPELCGLRTYLDLNDRVQRASLQKEYRKAYKEGFSKTQKTKIKAETKKRKHHPEYENKATRKKPKSTDGKQALGKRKSRNHHSKFEKKAKRRKKEINLEMSATEVMSPPPEKEKTKKPDSPSSDYSWSLRLFGNPKIESSPRPTNNMEEKEGVKSEPSFP